MCDWQQLIGFGGDLDHVAGTGISKRKSKHRDVRAIVPILLITLKVVDEFLLTV